LLKEVQNEAEEIALTPVVVPIESSLVINHHPAPFFVQCISEQLKWDAGVTAGRRRGGGVCSPGACPSHPRRCTPSFRVLSAINRARPQLVSRKYNFIFEIVSIESTENKNKNI
jgi:hypothetical protein